MTVQAIENYRLAVDVGRSGGTALSVSDSNLRDDGQKYTPSNTVVFRSDCPSLKGRRA